MKAVHVVLMVLALAFSGGAFAQLDCSIPRWYDSWQVIWDVGRDSKPTAAEACTYLISINGDSGNLVGTNCHIYIAPSERWSVAALFDACAVGGGGGGGGSVTLAPGATVSLVVSPMSETQVADYLTLWSLFLGAGVTVLLLKAIYSRFKLSKYES